VLEDQSDPLFYFPKRTNQFQELDFLYAQFLEAGFIELRMALNSKDWEWIEAVYEVLHNVPSLIGETNVKRHEYFLRGETIIFTEWASAPGREETHSRMLTYYKPIWDKMEPLVFDHGP
jgi:hypothetical protein